jgi:hypothetical protein
VVAVLTVASEGCFWGKSKQQATPEWLTKESLNEFNSALDKQQKNRGRRDVEIAGEEGATVVPTEAPESTSFWGTFSKGVKDIYKKAKEDAKTLSDRLEENLGL